MSKNERLDIEDEDARRERLGKLFADFSESKSAESESSLPNPEASRPFAVPESDVLARVRAFLPDFQASTNQILARAASDPNSVNLERVKKGEGAVAMDLGLGVYDVPGLQGREAESGNGLGPVVDSSGSVPDEEEGSEDDDEEGDSSDNESSDGDGSEKGQEEMIREVPSADPKK